LRNLNQSSYGQWHGYLLAACPYASSGSQTPIGSVVTGNLGALGFGNTLTGDSAVITSVTAGVASSNVIPYSINFAVNSGYNLNVHVRAFETTNGSLGQAAWSFVSN